MAKARKQAEARVERVKSLLNYVKTAAPRVPDKLIGRNYSFTLSKLKELTVEVNAEIENEWDAFEKLDFSIEECTTVTTVLSSRVGDTLSRQTKTKTRVLPNVEALRSAYRTDPASLPPGVRVFQKYAIRTGRVAGKNSTCAESFLREADPSFLESGSGGTAEDS